jgi:hypothetical protein
MTKTTNLKGRLCAAKTDSYTDQNDKKVISRKKKQWKKPKDYIDAGGRSYNAIFKGVQPYD